MTAFRNESTQKFTKISALAIVLVGTLLGASACSTDVNNDENTVSSASPEASPSPAVSVEPTSEATPEQTEKPADEPVKEALVGEVVEHPFGNYVQAELPSNDPAYIVDPATFALNNPELNQFPVTDTFTPEQIESAQRWVVDFVNKEFANSIFNNSHSLPEAEFNALREQWWEDNKVNISPFWQDDFYERLNTDIGFLQTESWQKDRPEYKYVYGENESRVQDMLIKVREVSGLSDERGMAIYFKMDVAYDIPVLVDGEPMPIDQRSYGDLGYGVQSDGQGGWYLSGWEPNVSTYEAWTNDSEQNQEIEAFRETLR